MLRRFNGYQNSISLAFWPCYDRGWSEIKGDSVIACSQVKLTKFDDDELYLHIGIGQSFCEVMRALQYLLPLKTEDGTS